MMDLDEETLPMDIVHASGGLHLHDDIVSIADLDSNDIPVRKEVSILEIDLNRAVRFLPDSFELIPEIQANMLVISHRDFASDDPIRKGLAHVVLCSASNILGPLLSRKWGTPVTSEQAYDYLYESYLTPKVGLDSSLSLFCLDGFILGGFGVHGGETLEATLKLLENSILSDIFIDKEIPYSQIMNERLRESAHNAVSRYNNIAGIQESDVIVGGDLFIDQKRARRLIDILSRKEDNRLLRSIINYNGFNPYFDFSSRANYEISAALSRLIDSMRYSESGSKDIYRFFSLIIGSIPLIMHKERLRVYSTKKDAYMLFWTPPNVKESNMSEIFQSLVDLRQIVGDEKGENANGLLKHILRIKLMTPTLLTRRLEVSLRSLSNGTKLVFKGRLLRPEYDTSLSESTTKSSRIMLGAIPLGEGSETNFSGGLLELTTNVQVYQAFRFIGSSRFLESIRRWRSMKSSIGSEEI